MFRVDETKHRYYHGARELLGVTSVLAATGIADYSDYPAAERETYLARGRAVHAALAQIINGTFDREYLQAAPQCAGFIVAGERFLVESGAKVLLAEERVYDLKAGYAGTFDLIIRWRDRLWLPDFKCGKAQKATAIQTALYVRALPSLIETVGYVHADEPHGRFAVELHGDGTFKPHFYTDLENFNDEQIGMCAVAIAGWQIRNNGRLTGGSNG